MQWKVPAEPQVAVQIAAIAKRYDEAANKNDAVALGALFSEDAVFLADTGPGYGVALSRNGMQACSGFHYLPLFSTLTRAS